MPNGYRINTIINNYTGHILKEGDYCRVGGPDGELSIIRFIVSDDNNKLKIMHRTCRIDLCGKHPHINVYGPISAARDSSIYPETRIIVYGHRPTCDEMGYFAYEESVYNKGVIE